MEAVTRVTRSTMPCLKFGLREWLRLMMQPAASLTEIFKTEFCFCPGGCLGTELLLNINQELVV